MTDIRKAGTFKLGTRTVKRLGYGAMQLAGKGVFGPPKDRDGALAVLREAIASGVDHIDTSDFYGPHITNQLIREALHPYADGLVIVTKVGARRGEDGSWNPAFSKEDLTRAVYDNLRNLGVDVLDVVNLRLMFDVHGPAEGSLEAPLTVLAELQQQGLIRHLGLSNVTRTQVAEGRAIAEIVGVQNQYNLAHRHDDALIDELAAARFSRRCATDAVPGISRMFGERCSSQASATCIGVASSCVATSDSAVDCSGVKPPSGKNGT